MKERPPLEPEPPPGVWQRYHAAFPDDGVPFMAWSGSREELGANGGGDRARRIR